MIDWGDEDFDEMEPPAEVKNACRCGECCRRLIIEVGLEDAEREPKIAEKGSPIYTDYRLTASKQPELEGYLLNDTTGDDHACVFWINRPTFAPSMTRGQQPTGLSIAKARGRSS